MNDSLYQDDENQRNPFPQNSQNIKNGITKYKMKLKEKKKLHHNSEKNSKNPNMINSKGKWMSEKEPGKKYDKIKFIKKFGREY